MSLVADIDDEKEGKESNGVVMEACSLLII
jgi:hypothetical protein